MNDDSWKACLSRVGPGGCVQPHLEGFAADLRSTGFAVNTVRIHAQAATHLGRWMDVGEIELEQLTDETLGEFAEHRCACPEAGRHRRRPTERYVARVRRFVEYLRRQGVAPPGPLPAADDLPAPLLGFRAWMTRHRGVTERTVVRCERLMARMLPSLGDDPCAYNAALVRRVLLDEVRGLKPGYAKTFVDALRAFLRFHAAEDRCSPHLVHAVPAVAQWRLSALPRFLEAADVERVVGACDTDKSHGLRDRAVLLLLARLGLRAGDIVAMSLGDLDWDGGKLRVRGKGRREVWLPLPQDAGDALLEYLVHARPAADLDRVFLCSQAPVRPFSSSTSVSEIVRRALQRAGLENVPFRGAHLLRHSAATSMLRSGASLDIIGTMLRHESSDTTAYYAKVDTDMLAPIAQPWPEGAPC